MTDIKYPFISMNQIPKFIRATANGKLKIIQNQKKPSKYKVTYYASATAGMRNYIKKGFDPNVIIDCIKDLQSKEIDPNKKNANTKKSNQILALKKFLEIEFPDIFKSAKATFSTTKFRRCHINGVDIIISPDIIVHKVTDGIKYIGAIKFNVHKEELDYSDGRHSAALLYHFLDSIKEEDEIVDCNFCLCIDVMHSKIYRPIGNIEKEIASIKNICNEVNNLWKCA